MEEIIKSLKKLILDAIEQNEKITSVHLLETLKYIIIENLKNIDGKIFVDASKNIDKNNFLEVFENKSIISRIYFYSDSFAKIKSKYEEDNLFIIIDGHKSVSIVNDDIKTKNTQCFDQYKHYHCSNSKVITFVGPYIHCEVKKKKV